MPPTGNGDNGWREYQKLVLAELERCDKRIREVEIRVAALEMALAIARTKLTMYSGIVAIIISALVSFGLRAIGK